MGTSVVRKSVFLHNYRKESDQNVSDFFSVTDKNKAGKCCKMLEIYMNHAE